VFVDRFAAHFLTSHDLSEMELRKAAGVTETETDCRERNGNRDEKESIFHSSSYILYRSLALNVLVQKFEKPGAGNTNHIPDNKAGNECC